MAASEILAQMDDLLTLQQSFCLVEAFESKSITLITDVVYLSKLLQIMHPTLENNSPLVCMLVTISYYVHPSVHPFVTFLPSPKKKHA